VSEVKEANKNNKNTNLSDKDLYNQNESQKLLIRLYGFIFRFRKFYFNLKLYLNNRTFTCRL